MTTSIAINGACGRMGQTLGRLASCLGDFDVVQALEAPGHPAVGSAFGPMPKLRVTDTIEEKVDALIDFSIPKGTILRLEECVEKGVPAVVCTTGFTEEQRAAIEKAAEGIAVVFSSNMSVGINVLFRLVPEFEKLLGPEFDVDIIETHHKHKKDAPSGTAKTLAERLAGEPVIHSLRSGEEVGEHRVVFGGPGERVEILHRADTRDVFAMGALRAAEFAAGAAPGLYTMLDVIGKE